MRCDVGTTIRPRIGVADSSQPIRVRRLATHARSLAECVGSSSALGIPSPAEGRPRVFLSGSCAEFPAKEAQ